MEHINQGTDSWLSWRSKGIGSSDAPIIMQVSPYKTAYQLWENKTGLVKDDFSGNWATERGNRLEPIARAKYELETNNDMAATLFEHKECSFLLASLDGWNPKLKRGLRSSVEGEKTTRTASSGKFQKNTGPNYNTSS